MESWENEGGNLGLKLIGCPVCGYGEDWLDPEVWPTGIPHLACIWMSAIQMYGDLLAHGVSRADST